MLLVSAIGFVVQTAREPALDMKCLRQEFKVLEQEQENALKAAAYIPMSRDEAARFDKRRDRLIEIGKLLGRSA
jgi:hypothetical protein